MGLGVRDVRLKPRTIAKGGGTVTFVFEASPIGDSTAQKTRYTIPAEFPYVFDNATDQADPRVVAGHRREVVDRRDHSQSLQLRKVGGADTLSVDVNAAIFEVDANGNPLLGISGRPLLPKHLTGTITIT